MGDEQKCPSSQDSRKHIRLPHLRESMGRKRQDQFFYEGIDEQMNSSDEESIRSDMHADEEVKAGDVAPFDDGEADVDNDYFGMNRKQKNKGHIDLKDLSEQNFLDLIAAKNQDKRFYGWLHFHPLFDDENWSSSGASFTSHDDDVQDVSLKMTASRNRRASEHNITLKDKLINEDDDLLNNKVA